MNPHRWLVVVFLAGSLDPLRAQDLRSSVESYVSSHESAIVAELWQTIENPERSR